MFKVIERPEFTHTVPVLVPVDGGHEEQSLKVRFRALPDDELGTFDHDTNEGTHAFLRVAIVRIEDVVGTDGKPVPYSDALRDQLLQFPFVRVALLRAYSAAVTGARLGN